MGDILFNVPLDKKECIISQPEDTIEIMFGISYTNSKVIALNVRMFKDFLAGIETTITRAVNAFRDSNNSIRVIFKVTKGICSIKAKINPVTKLDYSFPVNDECSYGKATFKVEELRTIRDALREHHLLDK